MKPKMHWPTFGNFFNAVFSAEFLVELFLKMENSFCQKVILFSIYTEKKRRHTPCPLIFSFFIFIYFIKNIIIWFIVSWHGIVEYYDVCTLLMSAFFVKCTLQCYRFWKKLLFHIFVFDFKIITRTRTKWSVMGCGDWESFRGFFWNSSNYKSI